MPFMSISKALGGVQCCCLPLEAEEAQHWVEEPRQMWRFLWCHAVWVEGIIRPIIVGTVTVAVAAAATVL